MGNLTELATGHPGYCSLLPNTIAPLATMLKLNGYSTAQFGKCHEVPVWQTSPAGPFDQWPTGGGGFEYFYGFIGGETTSGTRRCTREQCRCRRSARRGGLPLHGDMTDKALAWIGQQKALTPDKPFFVYFAPGATHAPHHVPKEWADKYKGRFDAGWDKLREETFARQKKLGVIPQDCELTKRHEGILRVGRDAGGAEAGARPADGGLRRFPGVRRPTTSAGCSSSSSSWGSSRTRWSSTSPATTGRPRKGPSTAPSTRCSS